MKNTASQVSDQIIQYSKNVIDILNKIQQLMSSSDPTITFNVNDKSGIATSFTVPSFGYLQSEIKRLNNNINSMYSLNDSGSMIQTDGSNTWKKIIAVDLNVEPKDVQQLNTLSTFSMKDNWFFDKLINPAMFVNINLSDQIDDNVHKCLIKRYIVQFEKNEDGSYTQLAQQAIASFNTNFRNITLININDFLQWHATTTGIVDPLNPKSEEAQYELEPNKLSYDGLYTVIRIDEDNVNKKLWYVLNTLDYRDVATNTTKQLALNDELVINMEGTNSRYKIIEISNASVEVKVRFERIEGNTPIPVGIGTLKIYSPVLYTKTISINIGYDERCVLFVKPINGNNNIVAKNWSFGVGFWTNDLKLSSSDSDNGLSLEQFYATNVDDFGAAIKDMVARRVPNKLAGQPNVPQIFDTNFKVVQINKHLTDNTDSKKLADLNSQQTTLKSEITELNAAIESKNNQLKNTTFNSDADRSQFNTELDRLIKLKDSKSTLLASVVSDILELSKVNTSIEPKYRLRGFWDFPEAVVTSGTYPQEIVQFEYAYRYLSKDGKETPLETYDLNGKTAVTPNWIFMRTDVRLRKYNAETDTYEWVISDVSDADTPNINQLEIPIQANEIVEFKIRSISEVGYPDAPVMSDWSDTLNIPFPDNLTSVLNDSDFILQEATKEDIKVSIYNDLAAKGLNDVLNQRVTINNKTYIFSSDSVLSGFKDENGNQLNLLEYLTSLQNRVAALEEAVKYSKGQLEVLVYRGNDYTVVNNGAELSYTIECEDYTEKYEDTTVGTGRIVQNNIYIIKDFILRLRNRAVDSPLGLLSSRIYNSTANNDAYNKSVPQVFWVNDQNELLMSNNTGVSLTQIDNQFLWSVNYDTINQTNAVKLANNIGNSFTANQSNSLTSVLASNEYNLGFFENSMLAFNSQNNSLMDASKWIDKTISVASTNKLLTTIHPSVDNLSLITEKNSSQIKTINSGEENDIVIPINIYFKLNALDNSKQGLNNSYINLNNATSTVRHQKKIKFMFENESENRSFSFSIKFNINRNKIGIRKTLSPLMLSSLRATTSVAYKINKI